MRGRLQDKVCIVTCGSSGIGLAAAKRFSDEGARIFIIGRNAEDLERAQFEIGGTVTALRSDPEDRNDLRSLIGAVERQAGRIDVLYLDANMFGTPTARRTDDRRCDRSLGALVDAVHASNRLMPLGSSIILTGSPSNDAHSPVLFAALRASIATLAKGWAEEFRPRRIRVNVVSPKCPDVTDARGVASSRIRRRSARTNDGIDLDLSREGPARLVANCLLFLASDESDCVTGTEMHLDYFEAAA